MDIQEFKVRMLAKIKKGRSLQHEDLSSITVPLKGHFARYMEKRKVPAVQPNYTRGISESQANNFENIITILALGPKQCKILACGLLGQECKSEVEYFEAFKNYLYSGKYEKAITTLEKCLVFDEKKYMKWKMLALYLCGRLTPEGLAGVSHVGWELEAEVLEVFLTNSEAKAKKLFGNNEYYGGISWTKVLAASFLPDKNKKRVCILRRLVEKYPNNTEAYLILIKLLYDQKIKEGQGLCNSAILRFGIIPEEFMVYISIKHAQFLVLEEKYRLSLELLQETFKRYPRFTIVLYYYGKTCVKWKNSNVLASGIGALKDYIKFTPANNKAMLWITEAYILRKQVHQLVKTLLKINPSSLSLEKQHRFEAICIQFEKEINFVKALRNQESPPIESLPVGDTFRMFHESNYLKAANDDYKRLKILRNCQLCMDYDLKFIFEEIRFLKQLSDADYPLKWGELVERLQHPKVSPNQWTKALLLYSKFLFETMAVEDCFKVLKSISKIFPRYSFNLSFVEKIQDSILSGDSLDYSGSFSSSRHSRAFSFSMSDPQNNPRKIAETAVDEVVETKNTVRARRYTHQVSNIKVNSSIPTIKDSNHLNDSKNKIKVEQQAQLTSWMFSSIAPTFLYKIGKYAAKGKAKEPEGIIALKDFAEIVLKFDPDIEYRKKYLFRSRMYLLLLYKQTGQDFLFSKLQKELVGDQCYAELSRKLGV